MKEIYTSNHIWTLFENFLVDMAMVTALNILSKEFIYIYSSLCNCSYNIVGIDVDNINLDISWNSMQSIKMKIASL